MELFKLPILFLFIHIFQITSKAILSTHEDDERLIYNETLNEKKMRYLINTKNDYQEIYSFTKDEVIKNSSTYSYKWSNLDKNKYIDLTSKLRRSGSSGSIDISMYDAVYLKLYSPKKIVSTICIVFYCETTDQNKTLNSYIIYKVFNWFRGWKEIIIPFSNFVHKNSPDITKVTKVHLSSGWSKVQNPKVTLNFDKLSLTKLKITSNYKKNEINIDNYKIIINRLKYLMAPSLIDNSDNEVVSNRLVTLTKSAKDIQNKMSRSGEPFNFAINNSIMMINVYSNIFSMAVAYGTEGGELFRDRGLFEDIVYALDYMHKNFYDSREQEPFAGNDNWFHWDIKCPQFLVKILCLLSDDLTQKQINKYLKPLNRYNPLPSMTMANRIDIAFTTIFAGALQQDYRRIALSVEMLRECFKTVEKGDGFYKDGSFIQHDYFPMTGKYGISLIKSLSTISFSLEKTIFRLDEKMKNYQYNWIINSFLPIIYNGIILDSVRGREISANSTEPKFGSGVISSLCLIINYETDTQKNLYLKSVLKYMYSYNYDYFKKNLNPTSLIILENIKNDNSISAQNINNFAKVFSRMDRAISQYNNTAISISMSSTRIGKYEALGKENLKGWYTGDGMTYIYTNIYDYAKNYWSDVNYYRIPGSTVTKEKRELLISRFKASLAQNDFAGGSYNNINMVVGMKLISKYIGNKFNSTLKANKAYFVFGDKLICLGNNINCKDKYSVETIIENRKLNNNKFYIGGNKINNKNGNVNDNIIYVENYGGIYIPDYKKVKYNVTNSNFLELYFSHGKKINNATYAYMIFPKCEKKDIETLSKQFTIMANNKIVSAVKNNINGIMEYVFWTKGKFGKVEVEQACTLIIDHSKIYVSDPTQKLKNVIFKVNGQNYNVKVSKGYTSSVDNYRYNLLK